MKKTKTATAGYDKSKAIVDIVIPTYNYAGVVSKAIRSVKNQKLNNFACYIVDDGSTDNTREVVEQAISDDVRFTYIFQNNSGVAIARNNGVFSGTGKYVCCLDADDEIAPEFLEACVSYLEENRDISIAYTGLWYTKPNGEQGMSPWPGEFDYDKQLQGHNQIPTCNVARREVWERLGGQRQRYAPNGAGEEDAELWLRSGAYGFVAKKVTDAGLFKYSWMSGGVSGNKQHKMTDYRSWHPWIIDGMHPFASLSTPANMSHPVRQYDEPIISVVIPVGPGHKEFVIDSLDSLDAQTYRKWEVIVVDDTGDNSENFHNRLSRGFPHIIYKKSNNSGSGAARNLGASVARGAFLVFLDADDWLHPMALDLMLKGWEQEKAIIFTDHVGKAILSKDEANELRERLIAYNEQNSVALFWHGWQPYDSGRAQNQPNPSDMYHWCLVTTLVPREWHIEIGGFDESMESWEDWDYYIRMAKSGKCFLRVPERLVVYRYYTGTRRETGVKDHKSLIKYMTDKYKGVPIMGCNCGKGQTDIRPITNERIEQLQQSQMRVKTMQDSEFLLVDYLHPNRGQHRVMGGSTAIDYNYRSGGDRFLVHRLDVAATPHLYRVVELTVPPVQGPGVAPAPVSLTNTPTEQEMASSAEYDLQGIGGISPSIQHQLNANGVHTLKDLLDFGARNMVEMIKGVGTTRAEAIIQSANIEAQRLGLA